MSSIKKSILNVLKNTNTDKSFTENNGDGDINLGLNDLNDSDKSDKSDINTEKKNWGEYIMSITWKTWIIIIFLFALLGFNIFTYLSQGTNEVTGIFRPFIKKITGIFLALTGQVINVSAEGAKKVVNTSANVIDTGANATDKALTEIQNVVSPDTGELIPNPQKRNTGNMDYEADDSLSSIQTSKKGSGWCYIGEDQNIRTCAKVGYNDSCMSGDIFPTQEICMNPNLRV